MFRDREHAGRLLAQALHDCEDKRPLVLAIPRGAVPIGRIVSETLGGELDVVLVRKLGAPGEPELAIGAVDEDGHILLNEVASHLHVDQEYVDRECRRQRAVLSSRRSLYTPNRPAIPVAGRTVIVLDDGIATGATMIAALRATRRKGPRELIAAAAVIPPETLRRIEREADRVVCLEAPAWFAAVGQFFASFEQVSDEEVIEALAPRGARL